MGKRSASIEARRKALARKTEQRPLRLERWCLAVIALAAVVPFLHTLPYQFVYDDDFQVLRNPVIRDWSNVRVLFTTSVWQFMNPGGTSNYYRPIHMLLHMAGYQATGLEPQGYHAINIVLHAACSLWVALIASRLTGDRSISLAAGLIYALHPIHAESVTWIAAVTDPSCAFFYLGALYFYVVDGEKPSGRSAALVLGFYFAALFAKEMAFTFPVVALLLDWVLRRQLRFSRYAMFAAAFAVYAAMRLHALGQFMIRQTLFDLDAQSRVLSTIVFVARYISKLVVPYDISAFHVFSPTRTILSGEFLLAAMVLGLFAAALWYFRGNRPLLFLFGFSLITLVPVLNLQGVGENVFADRYLYIPTAASSIILPLAVREIWRHHPIPGWNARYAAGVALGTLLAVYGVLLWSTTTMWRNNKTLYTETLKRSPNAMLIANNLGQYYQSQGDYVKAREVFNAALDMWPRMFMKIPGNLASAYAGLGGAYLKELKLREAKENFIKSYEISQDDPVVLDNLGSVYLGLGDFKTARAYYEQALAKNPKLERIHNNLAALALADGDFDRAIALAEKALTITPRIGEAHIIIARALTGKGKFDEARASYRRAVEVDPAKAAIVEADLKKLEGRLH